MPPERIPQMTVSVFLPVEVGTPKEDMDFVNVPAHAWMLMAPRNEDSRAARLPDAVHLL